MNNKWDYGWKVLCDPRLPWGRWFIGKLTEGRCEDYAVEVAAEVTDLNTEQHQYDRVTYADKFLQFVVDDKKKVLHLEFQSTYDSQMCWRLLNYGLNFAKHDGIATARSETYVLPDAFIVNVRPTKFSNVTERAITLEVHRQVVSLTYPVVDVTKSVPEFETLVHEEDPEKVREAIMRLGSMCGGFTDASYSDEFLQACLLASNAKSYSNEGLDAAFIKKEVATMNDMKKSWSESLIEEGMQKGRADTCQELLRNLMKNMGVTEQRAREMLGLDNGGIKPAGSPGLRTMQL